MSRARIKLTREMIKAVRFSEIGGISMDKLAKSAKVPRRIVSGLMSGSSKSISAEDWGKLYPYLESQINRHAS